MQAVWIADGGRSIGSVGQSVSHLGTQSLGGVDGMMTADKARSLQPHTHTCIPHALADVRATNRAAADGPARHHGAPAGGALICPSFTRRAHVNVTITTTYYWALVSYHNHPPRRSQVSLYHIHPPIHPPTRPPTHRDDAFSYPRLVSVENIFIHPSTNPPTHPSTHPPRRRPQVSVKTEEFVNVTVVTPDGQAKTVPAPVDPTCVRAATTTP